MKNFKLTKYDDITAVPSDELNRKTISAMREKRNEKNAAAFESVTNDLPLEKMAEAVLTKKIRIKKIVTIAAAACAAVFLMGMGVRVFEYLTYVPGMGIVTAEQGEVYTLESVVEAGGYRIEAMSMIPAAEGYYEGMWEVTILTNKEIPKEFHENPDYVKPIYFFNEDGESYELNCSGGSGIGSRYTGYAELGGAGDYTISWFDSEYTVTLKSMENSVWANYAYPVDQGLTVIAFPLAENSRYMVFDVILDPESENLAYWAEHSEAIWYQPEGITITDAEGNTYSAPSRSGHGIPIPESEAEHGINSLLSYKMETILTLDRVMEAPVERIEIDGISMEFRGISGTGFYTIEIPELDEVVDKADLPNGGVFFDSHGLKVQLNSATSYIDEENNTYEVWMAGEYPILSFEENISQAIVFPAYIRPDDIGIAEEWEYYRGSSGSYYDEIEEEGREINFTKDIVGYGDRKIRNGSIDVTFGDEIAACINGLKLIIEGEWIIDFTETAETAE